MAFDEPDTNPRLRNILLLDKSTAPLAGQVQEACSILGIELALLNHAVDQGSQQSTRSGPREEWTLRWLLKKLEASPPGPQSVYLELDVWLLFKELIPHLPAANLARLLRDHGFLDIVLKTMRSMKESMNGSYSRIQRDAAFSTSNKTSESPGAANSSSATVGASIKSTHSNVKTSQPIDAHNENNHSSPKQETNLGRLYRTLCATVWRLQRLAKDDSHGYSVEHLKMTLRASSEQASEVLGISLRMSDYLFQATEGSGVHYNTFDLMVKPWVTLWNCRSRKTTQENVDLAFAANCFVPALRLLMRFNESLASNVHPVIGVLEDLLLRHIVTPARDTFETLKKAWADKDDEGQSDKIGSLLAPLRNHVARHDYRSTSRAESVEAIHPVARFYSITTKHTPLGTSKERITSRPWLQYLFNRLSDQLPSPTITSLQTLNQAKDYPVAIKQMLEILVAYKINLGTSTLERVLTQVSKILNKETEEVNWHIVGLCLKIDSDVFVIPNDSERANTSSRRTPNKFLAALFTRLNDLPDPSQKANDEKLAMVMRNVLVPLVEGFAHARDSIGFINYWISNLTQSRKSTTELNPQPATDDSSKEFNSHSRQAQSIWEHEALLQAVVGLIESHLTVGQIETILKEAHTAVESADTVSDPTTWSTFSTSLVILDCVFNGCTNENTISKLSITVQSSYLALLSLCNAENIPVILRWRVWRCIATIKNRWDADLTPSPDIHDLEEIAALYALHIQSEKKAGKDPKGRLHSFHFLLSIIDNAQPLLFTELADSTVQFVVSLLNRYAELVISHLPDTGAYQIPHPNFFYDIPPEELKELLALQKSTYSYASMLCHRTAALRSVNKELQRKFFEGVFECDLLDVRRTSRQDDPPFECGSPWRDLLHWNLFEETGSLAHTYLTFQLDKFLNPGYWRKSWSVSDNAIYASAFDNIHRSPCSVFNRKQQTLIFNNALDHLPWNPQLLKNHVKMLLKLLAHPSKDFNLLKFPSRQPKGSQKRPHKSSKPALLEVAEQIYDCGLECYVDTEAIDLLKLLVQQVLGYQLSTGSGSQAVFYLTSYFESLKAYTRKVAIIMHGDQQEDMSNAKPVEQDSGQEYSSGEDRQDQSIEEEEEPVEPNIYSMVVLSGSLDFYRRHLKDLPAELQESLQMLPALCELRIPVMNALREWINSGRGNSTQPVSEVSNGNLAKNVAPLCQAAAAQYVEASYQDFFLDQALHSSTPSRLLPVTSTVSDQSLLVSECVEDLATKAAERSRITRRSCKDTSELKEALRLLRKTQRLLARRHEYSPLGVYRRATDTRNTLSEQKQLVQTITDSVKNHTSEELGALLTRLVHDDGNALDQNALLLLQSLITRQFKSSAKSSEVTSSALSDIVNHLSDILNKPQPYQLSIMCLHCINIIVHNQPHVITQWHIDQIVAGIVTCATHWPSIANCIPKQTGLQYLGLCRVFSTIIAFHRKRLGGRYHLILLVLRALLRPLFVPFQADPASTSSAGVLTATHAKAYSRLLLQLADPPLSSVTNHHHQKKHSMHHSLNDPTKIAKSIAGQHLHYLIMTYCEYQLKGRLTQEVREKLRPGIWAVLDVISQETMRVMNAGMDKAGRAVWKGLYEEWRRDGRGEGKGR